MTVSNSNDGKNTLKCFLYIRERIMDDVGNRKA
jgi:hypothetical protein